MLRRNKAMAMDAATTPPAAQGFSHAQVVRVLWGILPCMFLAAMDQTVVVPAVPAIAADLDGFGDLAWIVSSYLLTATAATPIYGKLSDIYGRRRLLLIGISLFGLASILCALAHSLVLLVAARALQGLGGAGLMAMSQAVIADVVSPRERGRYQGYMAGTWATASVAGPILGGWMTENLSWHWIFWVNLPVCVMAFVLSNRALRVLVHTARPARIDYLGALLLTGFVGAVLSALSRAGEGTGQMGDTQAILVPAGVAAVLFVLLALQQRRAPDPLLPPRLFGNAVLVCGIAIATLASAALLGATFLLPLFFQLARGAGEAASGSLLVPFLVTSTLGAFVSGQLARRFGRVKGVIAGGLVLATLGFVAMAVAGAGTPTWLLIAELMVIGFGLGTCMPTSMVVVQNAAERRDIGAATGALLLLRSLGSAFGSTLAGASLAAGFAAALTGSALVGRIDLGALRGHRGPALDVAETALARAALEGAFHLGFGVCAALTGLCLIVTLLMRDVPLRSGETKT